MVSAMDFPLYRSSMVSPSPLFLKIIEGKYKVEGNAMLRNCEEGSNTWNSTKKSSACKGSGWWLKVMSFKYSGNNGRFEGTPIYPPVCVVMQINPVRLVCFPFFLMALTALAGAGAFCSPWV